MYLGREELTKIADQIFKPGENTDHPFEPEKQIRVCSVDIRVDCVFWRMKRSRKPIDLGASKILEISPRRLWRKVVVEKNAAIVLKPGEMLLGRTYEKICMPIEYVGKINTRSSYARLGISTACNCDLINPGYVGHVPLEITNTTQNSFKIRPYLPLCQIFILPVQGEKLQDSYDDGISKYMDDEGTPSVWWRDELVKKISSETFPTKLTDNAIDNIREKFAAIDDDGIYRLQRLMDKNTFENSEELMETFTKSERLGNRIQKAVYWIVPAVTASLLGGTLYQLNQVFGKSLPPNWMSWTIWGLTIVFVVVSLWIAMREKTVYYAERV